MLLVVFTIGNIPKKYLHDILYAHADETYATHHSGKTSFTNYKFCCGFVNAVSVTPSIAAVLNAQKISIRFFGQYKSAKIINFQPHIFYCFGHRGPPLLG